MAGQHGGLPVVDEDERVVGFISESDVLNAVLRGAPPETRVRELMSNPVLVVDEFSTTDEVMSMLRDGKVRYLPVVRAGAASWASSRRTTCSGTSSSTSCRSHQEDA